MSNFERIKQCENEYQMADLISGYVCNNYSKLWNKDETLNSIEILRWLQSNKNIFGKEIDERLEFKEGKSMKNSDAIKILKMVEAHGILTKEAKELAIKALESVREWIPVKKSLPMPETEVFILVKRKTQACEYCVTTTAIYEDGRMPECYSCWDWEDIDGEWDEENDCRIIPKGWWESRHYNPDGVYNNAIDDEVIAWLPLPLLPDYEIEQKGGQQS